MQKYRLISAEIIDLFTGSIAYEGKFKDSNSRNAYFYANISNFDSPKMEESELYIYTYPFNDICNCEIYDITLNFNEEDRVEIKKALVEAYQKSKKR